MYYSQHKPRNEKQGRPGNKATESTYVGRVQREGRECDSDSYKEECTDLVCLESPSLLLQTCLLSPFHLLLLFLLSLQVEFLLPLLLVTLVPRLVSGREEGGKQRGGGGRKEGPCQYLSPKQYIHECVSICACVCV